MAHHRERLPLRVEASQYFPAAESRAHDFQRDFAANGIGLFGVIHHPHRPFSKDLEYAIGPNPLRMLDGFERSGEGNRRSAQSTIMSGSILP